MKTINVENATRAKLIYVGIVTDALRSGGLSKMEALKASGWTAAKMKSYEVPVHTRNS